MIQPGRPRTRATRLAWAALSLVLFFVFNLGVRHSTLLRICHEQAEGTWVSTPIEEVRSQLRYLTDDGDVRRYFAYANAALGRPYHGFYVRSMESWTKLFHGFGFQVDADRENPAVDPPHGKPLVPYRDYVVEYPPGFFMLALPPAFLTRDADVYRVLFGLLMAMLLTLSVWLCLRAAQHLPGAPIEEWRYVVWMAGAALALGAVTTHRYDAVVALTVCGACAFAFERRPVLLGLAVGLGIGTKLVPVLIAPVFLLLLVRGRRWHELAIACAVTVAMVAIVFAPAVLAAGSALYDMIRYHGERPIQIESTAAAVLAVLHIFDPDALEVVRSFGSTNVVGPLTPAIGRLIGPLMLGGFVALYAWTWWRLGREKDDRGRNLVAARAAVVALVLFMVGGKVFSPQYLVWVLPLGMLLSLEGGTHGIKTRKRALLWLGLMAATQVIFPGTYRFVEELNPVTSLLVLLRNGMLMYWGVTLLRSPVPVAVMAHEALGQVTPSSAEHPSRTACTDVLSASLAPPRSALSSQSVAPEQA